MNTPYFVMLRRPRNAGFTPLFDEDDEVAMFEDERDAVEAAKLTEFGRLYGYEIFCEGCGEASS